MMDILEEAGPDIARRCYWDFGKWSDLWRVWRPVGSERPSRDAAVGLPVSACSPPKAHCAHIVVVVVAEHVCPFENGGVAGDEKPDARG